MLIKSLKSGNHYQFITLFVVCATGRSCLLFFNNVVPFDNKDSAKKKHRQIYRFIKVLCDRAEVPAGRGEYILLPVFFDISIELTPPSLRATSPIFLLCKTQRRRFNALLSHYLSMRRIVFVLLPRRVQWHCGVSCKKI